MNGNNAYTDAVPLSHNWYDSSTDSAVPSHACVPS